MVVQLFQSRTLWPGVYKKMVEIGQVLRYSLKFSLKLILCIRISALNKIKIVKLKNLTDQPLRES